MPKEGGNRKYLHVVRRGEGWAVEREGAKRASKIFRTQEEAKAYAREVAEREKGEVIVHDQKGRIRERDSYGSDPHPPKDREH
ncbi:DUF2188 domain-containing protein [Thermus sp. CCB_US3_UF1]|uniref:DUF2188 domain-containing protein n=1 Tax=Thermus sp. CCB_US3_UF1 TaxID=1111069 RepID=UPI0009D97E3C|nr:DUF2188 domain-containing protein [Thermus sp. CCB_US3_UF1]